MKFKRVFSFNILILFLSFSQVAVSASYVNVSVSQAKEMIDSSSNLVILDVRTWGEYLSGHIMNATLIPVNELEGRLDELDSQRSILVYCASGGRSSTASQILVDNGFAEVYNMLGGISAWITAGYPIIYIEVPTNHPTIQAAVNAASEGNTVFVGSYLRFDDIK